MTVKGPFQIKSFYDSMIDRISYSLLLLVVIRKRAVQPNIYILYAYRATTIWGYARKKMTEVSVTEHVNFQYMTGDIIYLAVLWHLSNHKMFCGKNLFHLTSSSVDKMDLVRRVTHNVVFAVAHGDYLLNPYLLMFINSLSRLKAPALWRLLSLQYSMF